MTFNSMEFVTFLLLVLGLHWLVPSRRRNLVLLVASYAFYGWWDPRVVGLLALSTAVDYAVGRGIGSTTPGESGRRRRGALLAASLTVNLGVLAAFKYAGFFAESMATALGSLGLSANPPLLEVVLPIGISFYTFQTLAYTIEVHRGRIEPVRDPVLFATFVAYFPQLVAGPIERAQRLIPQLADRGRRPPRGVQLQRAASLIVFGLVKKVVIADGVATVVNEAFADPAQASAAALGVAAVGFAIQIYGDFSGYSNIARGVSLLFGVELITNFREPYLSRTITEFWRRWHISLSTWLRDYLYVPLGGNRGGRARTVRNLLLTMLLGGLWHGAAWTFVAWGGLHGLYLVGHRLLGRRSDPDAPLRGADVPRILATFGLVTLTWIPFRADSPAEAVTVLQRLLTGASGTFDPVDALSVAVLALATLLLDLAQRRQATQPDRALVSGPVRTGLVAAGLGLAVLVFSGGTPEPFIYFQF